MRILLITCCLLFAASANCLAQESSKIDRADLKRHIESLTTGTLANRQTGTTGQKEAAAFISEKFKNLGLSSFDSSGYYQKIDLVRTSWGDVYLKSGQRKLKNFVDIISMGYVAQNSEQEIDVVFGGYGKADQLNQINVKGKLVLIFTNNLRASYDIFNELKKRNAAGLILANPHQEKQFEVFKTTFQDHILQKRFSFAGKRYPGDTVHYIHQVIVPTTEVKTILGVSIRALEKYIETNSIASCPESHVTVKCEKIKEEVETENVIGVLKGKRDESILLSAHYDTFNHDGQNPGADDNASGVATLFELAEQLSQGDAPPVNIIFLATTGEEDGLIGSKFYAQSSDFSSRKILFNLNVDMIGRSDDKHASGKSYLYCVGNLKNSLLHDAIIAADSLNDQCAFDHAYYNSKDNSFQNRGDHTSFLEKGVPSVMFFGGLHQDYHQAGDSASKINYRLLENRAKLINSVMDELLKGLKPTF